MDQARDVRVSRAVERHERSLQRSPPKDWRRQHPQVVAGVDDDAVSPSGTYRHLPCRPVEDQSPEKEEQAFSHVKKRSKPGHTIFVQPPQEYGNVQQRQRGGESPSPANKYAWDDAEYSTSGESMATTEDGSLAQSGMDGTVDNMLKVQPGWGFDDSRGLQRETVGQMTTAGAGAAGEGSYCGRPSLVPSPSRQKRHQNRLTAIRSPMVRPPSTEVPRESGEGYANASKADAGTDAGTDAVIPNRRNDTESSVANEGRHDARKDMSGCRQGAQLAQQPRSLSYRRTISASTGAHSGRRYSFDKGDDEVLPVSSPVSTGEQGESDDSRDIYPPRQQDLSLEHVQVQEGTSQRSDRPTVAPSTSTGSVVWVGGVGDEKEGQAVTERAAGVPKITTSRVSDDSGDDDARLSSLGDPIGVRTSVATGGTPSLSPSSSSLNLRSSLDVNGGGRGGGNVGVGHAARIAAQRAVAGKNGGGTR
ncbi:hypothetical protein QBC43DRAFT_86289 [Cladorrhinum sp. PSN259]|nr:hypothetical protein QBC43DRAFT_86289 [Cladorrhinum sp. PSN259]